MVWFRPFCLLVSCRRLRIGKRKDKKRNKREIWQEGGHEEKKEQILFSANWYPQIEGRPNFNFELAGMTEQCTTTITEATVQMLQQLQQAHLLNHSPYRCPLQLLPHNPPQHHRNFRKLELQHHILKAMAIAVISPPRSPKPLD